MSDSRSSDESRKPPNFVTLSGQPCDVAVEHVENVRDDQHDAGPEEFAEPEQHAAADVDRYADRRQDVRRDAGDASPRTIALMIRIAPRPMLAPNIDSDVGMQS